jgi:hypothetical protein
MGCQKCTQLGVEPKIYRYAKGFRWERIEVCKHRTRRYIAQTARTCKLTRSRHGYSVEMDNFILLNYPRKKQRGRRVMERMAQAFEERFGLKVTKGQIIGRYHRLRRLALKAMRPDARAVPSLPTLKFMERQ